MRCGQQKRLRPKQESAEPGSADIDSVNYIDAHNLETIFHG